MTPARIICTLTPEHTVDRLEDWRELLTEVAERVDIDGGVRLQFPPGAALAGRVAELAAAELRCCSFFEFDLRLTPGGTTLDVRAPAEARDLVVAVFGSGS